MDWVNNKVRINLQTIYHPNCCPIVHIHSNQVCAPAKKKIPISPSNFRWEIESSVDPEKNSIWFFLRQHPATYALSILWVEITLSIKMNKILKCRKYSFRTIELQSKSDYKFEGVSIKPKAESQYGQHMGSYTHHKQPYWEKLREFIWK